MQSCVIPKVRPVGGREGGRKRELKKIKKERKRKKKGKSRGPVMKCEGRMLKSSEI